MKAILQKLRNHKKATIIIASLVIVFIAYNSFTSPKNLVVTKDWQNDEKFVRSVRTLGDKDKAIFLAATVRSAFGDKQAIPMGATVGEVIDSQKEHMKLAGEREAKEAMLKKEVTAKRDAMQDEVNKILTFTFLGKDLRKVGYSDAIVMKMAFKNNSEKDISGIKGQVVFNDMFGDTIMSSRLKIDENIKAGEARTFNNFSIDYNQFIARHQQLANAESDKLKVTFEPEVIIFANGDKIELPEASHNDD